MADYISRETALACFHDWIDHYGHEHTADEMTEYHRIEDLPAADVRPVVRATWEPSEKYNGYVSCSNCHDCYIEPEWVERLKWRFCPQCGADMGERRADNGK